jgi:uncharacterized protein HemX
MVTIRIRVITLSLILMACGALIGVLGYYAIQGAKSSSAARSEAREAQEAYQRQVAALKLQMEADSLELESLRRANSRIINNLDKIRKDNEKRIAELMSAPADSIALRWAAFERRLDSLLARY